jgi:hypothetical protein
MEENDESKTGDKKVQELAAWLKKNCHRYQRFYTATYFVADIDATKYVAGVRLNISHRWGYVDILGLTRDEEDALEQSWPRTTSAKTTRRPSRRA